MVSPTSSKDADWDDTAIDEALRATELELRALHARRARILAAAKARGTHQAGGHRSISAYLRAACNVSGATARKHNTLAKLVAAHPDVADALEAGRISIDHAHQIARIYTNPRINEMLEAILDTLLDMAEHLSHGEFGIQVGTIIGLADQDGAFQEMERNVQNRRAWLDDMSGSLHFSASGGDPLTAAQLIAIFESFAEGELQADLQARKAEFGDQAEQHPLPRTQSQRNFDALVAIFTAAAGSSEGGALPEPTVNVVIDEASLHDTLAHAGLVLPNGNQIAIDDHGDIADPKALLTDLTAQLIEHPETLSKRMCNLSTGAAIHPSVALRSLLTATLAGS